MSEIVRIGDIVEVLDPDDHYPNYERMAEMMGLDRFNSGYHPLRRHDYLVVGKSFHDKGFDLILGIECMKSNHSYLVGIESVRVLGNILTFDRGKQDEPPF